MKIINANISKRRKITSHIDLYQNNNEIYQQYSNGARWKYEYDQNNNEIDGLTNIRNTIKFSDGEEFFNADKKQKNNF